jgi:putative methylase
LISWLHLHAQGWMTSIFSIDVFKMNKKKLEIILSKLEEIENPVPELEQYTTPGNLAAEILNLAYLNGDIEGKTVIDLGCGSGRFAIGSLLMGAKKVIAVEKYNNVIQTAKENLKKAEKLSNEKLSGKIEFICCDIIEADIKGDTIIQNPPFGIQKKNADRIFLEVALEKAHTIYSLHRHYQKTRKFIREFVEHRKAKIQKIIKFKFRIPYMFRFHKKDAVEIEVDLFVIRR